MNPTIAEILEQIAKAEDFELRDFKLKWYAAADLRDWQRIDDAINARFARLNAADYKPAFPKGRW